jgi:hypothetical protein
VSPELSKMLCHCPGEGATAPIRYKCYGNVNDGRINSEKSWLLNLSQSMPFIQIRKSAAFKWQALTVRALLGPHQLRIVTVSYLASGATIVRSRQQ